MIVGRKNYRLTGRDKTTPRATIYCETVRGNKVNKEMKKNTNYGERRQRVSEPSAFYLSSEKMYLLDWNKVPSG